MARGAKVKPLRVIADPFVVAAPTGVSIRTRLHPTPVEAAALREIGEHLGRLYRSDLAARVRIGKVAAKDRGRTERKRSLTALSSSRWAGSITRASEDQYQLSLRALAAEISHLRAATSAISTRLATEVGTGTGKDRGYRTENERYQKSRRHAHLTHRLEAAQQQLVAGRPTIVAGSGRLWRARTELDKAGLTQAVWEQRWTAARMFLTADGESGKRFGNETIGVDTDGVVSIKVPASLVPALGPRLVIDTPAAFAHRGEEWADRAHSNRSIRYDIRYKPEKQRWYLDASWGYKDTPVPSLGSLQQSGVIGVDLNADHLAIARVDASGNPVGTPTSIVLDLVGKSASTRDGRLRAAITTVLDHAEAAGAHSIAIENLNFQHARSVGHETMGRGARGKRFRATVSGIPTAKFRDRLVSMAANRGIHVVAVDPAYTSLWGGQHWLKPLKTSDETMTRHHAASIAIGRRALGCRIKRREDGPRTRQRTHASQPRPRLAPNLVSAAFHKGQARLVTPSHPGPPGTNEKHNSKTVRGESTLHKRTQ